MIKNVIKAVVIVLTAGIVLHFGYYLFVFAMFAGLFEPSYDKQDLVQNYEIKHREIQEVKAYFASRVPANTTVHIEFEDDDELGIFHVFQNKQHSENWNLKANSVKADSLLGVIGWDQQTLRALKTKLDAANCISLQSGEPLTVGYQRSGMGMYFYKVFDTPLSDSLRTVYNDGCTYSLYKEKVVLEYGGGAVGPQCFEDYSRDN
jgi:hypothetical protein